ncbi:MAG: tetratricopeptide repeat protein [Burkholderiales bacterium]|nr:tetratricopeptide repeat protein [Burkholderiales bacterium]
MPDVEAALAEARALQRRGRLDEARRACRAILDAVPTSREALRLAGLVSFLREAHDELLLVADEVARRAPDSAAAAALRGLACLAQGRAGDALASCEAAIALEPSAGDAWFGRGVALAALGRPGDALASYERALALCPDDTATLVRLGQLQQALGRPADALARFERALALDAECAPAHGGRANALAALGRLAEAVASYGEALAIDPFLVEALINRGVTLHALGRSGDALADFDRALQLAPESAPAWYNHGVVLQALGRLPEALVAYDRTIAIAPAHVDAHFNRGIALGLANRAADARASYDTAVALDPGYPYALGQAAFARAELCDWEGYATAVQRAREGVGQGLPACDPFALLGFTDDPALQLACARIHAARRFPRSPPLWRGRRHAHDRIRVAYLSANFCEHAVGYLVARLFELHDRTQFETTGISFGPADEKPMLARIRSAFDRFIDVRALDDGAVARVLYDLEIDIAVDLMGYTKDARPAILAHRPAPIQLNFLGYPGTMGADFIDYIVADRHLIAAGDEPHYAESVVRMPDSYQPNDSLRAIAGRTPARQEMGLPERGFVFCCFNNNYKITPTMFTLWMRLLTAVPDSVLWLLPLSASVTRNLRREAQNRGVDPARLVFAPRVGLPDHLARHRLADLFLDTVPYNAHTTASDALWAGLPVVTCAGRSFASRVAGSLLHGVGLPELVTTSLADYEALALRLAHDPAQLRSLRERLAQDRLSLPLFDSDRFRRNIEAAYRTMVARHARGEPPRGFDVEPPRH